MPGCRDRMPHVHRLTQLSVSTATSSVRPLRRHLHVGCSFFRILPVTLIYFRLTRVAGWFVVFGSLEKPRRDPSAFLVPGSWRLSAPGSWPCDYSRFRGPACWGRRRPILGPYHSLGRTQVPGTSRTPRPPPPPASCEPLKQYCKGNTSFIFQLDGHGHGHVTNGAGSDL